MDPIVGGALVGAGANIIGNLFNRGSTNSANRTNIKIAQMNNEWSERMMQKQMDYNTAQWQREADYNTEMWNKTNEYNSASNQAKRLREAGLNPALVMSGQNAGTASAASSPSGNSVGLPSPSSAKVIPNHYDFSGFSSALSNAIDQHMRNLRNTAEIDFIKTQKDVLKAKSAAELSIMAQEARSKKVQADIDELSKDLRLTNMNEGYLLEVQKRIDYEEATKLKKEQRNYQILVNNGFNQKQAMEISVMASQRDLNEFNSSIGIGKFLDEIKKRGIKLSDWQEKIIFGLLTIGKAFK